MTTIKKVYQEIFELLNSNQSVKVSKLLPELIELMSAKTNQETSYKVDGKVVAVFCYYHKVWELVSEHEYGSKSSTNTGLNTMCKVGVSNWTKQQRLAKNAQELLLNGLADGSVTLDQIQTKKDEIESARNVIVPIEGKLSFGTLAELQTYLAN